jgi:hypothetical protein
LANIQLHIGLGAVLDRLEHDAIALDEFEQFITLVFWRVGIDVETQSDFRESNLHTVCNAERAAKVNIAFGRNQRPI